MKDESEEFWFLIKSRYFSSGQGHVCFLLFFLQSLYWFSSKETRYLRKKYAAVTRLKRHKSNSDQ